MKKTFPVNINGKIYYIDEDAYTLLQNYLSQLRATFPGEEGAEILADIESRISELFDERLQNGASVIVIDNVNEVIEIMGRPEEIGGDEASGEPAGCPPPPPGAGPDLPPTPPVSKKLFRDERHKVFGGVLAGLGQYMNWDVTVLRILAVVLALFTYFWPCVLIYLIAWLVIPPARTSREILQMQGRPVNLETVGETVIDSATPPPAPIANGSDFANFINTAFLIIGKCLLAFFAFIGGVVAFATAAVALALIAAMACEFVAGNSDLLDQFGFMPEMSVYAGGWGITLLMFAVALPAISLFWAGCVSIIGARSLSRQVILALIVIEVMLIAGGVLLLHYGRVDLLSAVLPVSTVVPVSMT